MLETAARRVLVCEFTRLHLGIALAARFARYLPLGFSWVIPLRKTGYPGEDGILQPRSL
jgi:hypothetical protein